MALKIVGKQNVSDKFNDKTLMKIKKFKNQFMEFRNICKSSKRIMDHGKAI